MTKKTIKLDAERLDKVIHDFRKSLAKITKEFSDEIWAIYECVVQNNKHNNLFRNNNEKKKKS